MRFGRSYWKCYLLFIRPKQQLGLSTPLKMTDNYGVPEQSATPSAATFENWQLAPRSATFFITLRLCRSFPSIAGCSSRFRAKWSVVASRR
jgi:hypothetical protein